MPEAENNRFEAEQGSIYGAESFEEAENSSAPASMDPQVVDDAPGDIVDRPKNNAHGAGQQVFVFQGQDVTLSDIEAVQQLLLRAAGEESGEGQSLLDLVQLVVAPREKEGSIEVEELQKQLKKQQQRVMELTSELSATELELASSGVQESEDILALKRKAMSLVETIRGEKGRRLRAQRAVEDNGRKVIILSDHIEKLMVYLRHEATAKVKAQDQVCRLQKELELVKARSVAMAKKAQARERAIAELREGSKILEDQLRLMDEKYMELRTKLDYARSRADRDVRLAQKECNNLRMKWTQMSSEMGIRGALLDDVDFSSAGLVTSPAAGSINSKPSTGRHHHVMSAKQSTGVKATAGTSAIVSTSSSSTSSTPAHGKPLLAPQEGKSANKPVTSLANSAEINSSPWADPVNSMDEVFI